MAGLLVALLRMLVLVALVAWPRPSLGAEEGYHYEVDPWLDGGLTAGLFAFSFTARQTLDDGAGPWCGAACDRGDLNSLDRSVLDWGSDSAAAVSDWTVGATIGLPVLLSAWDAAAPEGFQHEQFWSESLLFAETMAVVLASTEVLKVAFDRPRPVAYKDDAPASERSAAGAARSFPSGHTANAFAAATAGLVLFAGRHDGAANWVVGSGLLGLAGGTAVLRVAGGKHFWTDVAGGAVLGASVGYLVPRLHRHHGAKGGVRFNVQPLVMWDGQAGVMVTMAGW
jgi:membrane-associated phospholipid phosphatase